jgi:hypothetical protein
MAARVGLHMHLPIGAAGQGSPCIPSRQVFQNRQLRRKRRFYQRLNYNSRLVYLNMESIAITAISSGPVLSSSIALCMARMSALKNVDFVDICATENTLNDGSRFLLLSRKRFTIQPRIRTQLNTQHNHAQPHLPPIKLGRIRFAVKSLVVEFISTKCKILTSLE